MKTALVALLTVYWLVILKSSYKTFAQSVAAQATL